MDFRSGGEKGCNLLILREKKIEIFFARSVTEIFELGNFEAMACKWLGNMVLEARFFWTVDFCTGEFSGSD